MTTRNASDVILSLETKIDQLLNIVISQDLIIKNLSNKHNEIIRRLDSLANRPTVVSSEPLVQTAKIPTPPDNSPAYRRGGRDLIPTPAQQPPAQTQNVSQAVPQPEIVVPMQPPVVPTDEPDTFIEEGPQKFPVTQKIVNDKKKPIFPVGVEIFNEAGQIYAKVKTNVTGKWMAQLPIGGYRIVTTALLVDQPGPRTNTQLITVDGKKSPQQLPELVVK
jgi:hypothetical protein